MSVKPEYVKLMVAALICPISFRYIKITFSSTSHRFMTYYKYSITYLSKIPMFKYLYNKNSLFKKGKQN